MHHRVGALDGRMPLPVATVPNPHGIPQSPWPHQTHLQSCPTRTPALLHCPVHIAFSRVLPQARAPYPKASTRGIRAQPAPASQISTALPLPTHRPCITTAPASAFPPHPCCPASAGHKARSSLISLWPQAVSVAFLCISIPSCCVSRDHKVPCTPRLIPHGAAMGKTGLWSCPGSLKVNNDDEMIMLEAAELAHLILYKIRC